MTDARYPGRWLWDLRLVLLSDSHHRAYVTSLALAVENRTDGLLTPDALRVLPGFDLTAPAALVAAGLWIEVDGGWLVVDFGSTQTSAAELEAAEAARRQRARDKKRRQRARSSSGDGPGDGPRDATGYVHQAQDKAEEQAQEGEQDMGEGEPEDYRDENDEPDWLWTGSPVHADEPKAGYRPDGWGGFVRADLASGFEGVA